MKNTTFKHLLFCGCVAMTIVAGCQTKNPADKNLTPGELSGKISISGAFALYPMAVQWGEEFKKLHPQVSFDIQGGGAGKGMSDALSGMVDIGMVSRSINEEETTGGAYPIAVAKDAVIPTINDQNPFLELLIKKGVTQAQFKGIWMEGKTKTWNDLLSNGAKESLEIFTRSDAAGAPETWAKYLGGKQEDLQGVGVFGDPGVAEAITKNKYSIGFNNVNYVYDIRTKKPYPGLRALPIDLNNNGTIDAEENFYETLDQLNDAIVTGKFPSPPARELYFVTKGKPSGVLVKEFLNWVLTDGQQFVVPSGYVKLPGEMISEEAKKLE